MNKSKYSQGMGASKMTTKNIEETCEEHDGEPYTNFCAAMTCVRALCPECIENHYIYHKNLRTQPEIHSFKSLRNQCMKKVGEILQRINSQENQGAVTELNAVFESSIRKIRESRDHCRKILDTYFSNLEDYVRKKMATVLNDESDMFVELEKANSIINELKILYQKLDDARSFLSAAHTIIKLDTEKIEEKIRQCYVTVNHLKDHHRVNLFVEKNYEQKLVNFLSKTVFYGNQQNMESMPRVAQELAVRSQVERSSSKERYNDLQRKSGRGNMEKSKGSQGDWMNRSRQRQSDYERQSSRQEQYMQIHPQQKSMNRKSSVHSDRSLKKTIIGMNTFKQSSSCKYLHFFQNDENILHFLDLQSDVQFSQIQLQINFKIPEFHKSISVPNGDLYLIGGSLPNNSMKSTKIYKYDFDKRTLMFCNNLKYGRSSHSICFNSKYIYILGGFTNNQMITNRCQRYDIINNKIEEIRPMNYGVCSFACCSFNGRYIYKFGGISDDNSIIHYIQVYDEKQGYWSVVNPSVQLQGHSLMSLSTSSAIQITQSQIMIMGGYDQSNEGQKQTYILKVTSEGNCIIRDINTYPLPYAQGFWNNTPILQNKLVFALQNVSTGQDQCIENLRRILVFDGMHWKCLNK